jgi:hypothetical protein
VSTERSLSTRIALVAAEIVLAVVTVALIVAIWLPIGDFRAWLTTHFFH